MVLVPAPIAKKEVIVTHASTTANDIELQTTTTTPDSSASSLCCSCCSCCNVFLLKSGRALKAAKAQFWDGEDTLFFSLVLVSRVSFRISFFFFASFFFFLASGDFFWIKLVVMEVLEISLQVYSLATSATNSQVDEVSLSAWIIAANFIVLPLVIILVPLVCSSSQHSSHHYVMATVMVVEVLFDVSIKKSTHFFFVSFVVSYFNINYISLTSQRFFFIRNYTLLSGCCLDLVP